MSKFLWFLLPLFVASFAFNQVNDAAYWSEIEIEKRINLRSSLSLSENIRLVENYSRVSTHFSQLCYKYKVYRGLSLELSYRFAQRFKYDRTMNYRNRLMFDINYKLKLKKKLEIEFRERYQLQFEDALKTNWSDYTQIFRSKAQISLDLKKKYSPFVSGEVFLQDFNFLNNLRFGIGISYKVNKKIGLLASYLINKEIQVANPATFYIVNTSLSYTF